MSSIFQNKQGLKVLVAGAVLQLFLGIIYIWSVFKAPVSEFYGWEPEKVRLTASFMLSFFCMGILVGGKMQMIIGVKMTTLIGGLMVSAGMLATALIPAGLSEPQASIFLIFLFYGIIGGFGVGAAYNAIISTAQKWFPKNRGFATGVSVGAFGFSTVIFAPLVEMLNKTFQLNITFLILSGVFASITLLVFGFIKIPQNDRQSTATSVYKEKQYTLSEMIRTSRFYYLTLSIMFGTSVFFVINPDLKDLALNRGAASFATLLIMLMGISNALGRLCLPLLSDKIGREQTGFLILSSTALGAFGLCFAEGILLIAIITIIAFCYGGIAGLYPVLTSDNFGVKNVGSNYGAVMIGFMISALVFPFTLNLIEGQFFRFIVLGTLATIGVTFIVILKIANAKKQKKEVDSMPH